MRMAKAGFYHPQLHQLGSSCHPSRRFMIDQKYEQQVYQDALAVAQARETQTIWKAW